MRAQGKTPRAGYGWQHQLKRLEVAKVVAAGEAFCSRCHKPIHPGQPWDLDHADGLDKRLGVYRGPSHRGCNRAGKRSRRWSQVASSAAQRQQPRPRALDYFDTDQARQRTS